jgi:hypothetical protein
MTRQERLTLVRVLLDLDQPVKGYEIVDAWDSAIGARVKAVNEGRASGVPYDQTKRNSPTALRQRTIIVFLPGEGLSVPHVPKLSGHGSNMGWAVTYRCGGHGGSYDGCLS